MRWIVLIGFALLAAGCAGGSADEREGASAGEATPPPAWLNKDFADGTVELMYPSWWDRSRSPRFGALLSDNRSRHPAFVSIRYFDEGRYASRDDFADFAGRTIRPPDGRGLTLLYTQTAQLGGLRGVQATFMWATRGDTPVGPTMRTYGIELPSGRVAFLVFASERPTFHGGQFGWIRKTLEWTGGSAGTGDRHSPARGRNVNEP